MLFRAEVQIRVDGGSLSTVRAQGVLSTVVHHLYDYGQVMDTEKQYPTEPDAPTLVSFVIFEAKDFMHAQELLQNAVDQGMQVFPGKQVSIDALLLR